LVGSRSNYREVAMRTTWPTNWCRKTLGILVCGLLAAQSASCSASGSGAGSDGSDDTLSGISGNTPSDPAALASCATGSMVARRLPVYMLVVLDGSGSMIELGKWQAVTDALGSFVNDAVTRADPGLALGLTVFSDSSDKTLGYGPYPDVDVPIAFVDADHARALVNRVVRVDPLYETPMAAVLTGQYPRLEQFNPSAPLAPGGKKVLVLMTDGVPYPNATEQRPVVVSSAKTESGKEVKTFVVGIGSATPYDPGVYDPPFLAQVALAGGTANDGCDPEELSDESRMCHLQIAPEGKSSEQLASEFYAAIDGVRSAMASCELGLDNVTGDLDPRRVNVVYDAPNGQETLLLEDLVDGWTWDDPTHPTHVVLHGRACKTLKAQPDGVVKIVVGCRSAIR
jgi:hypothetical protein